MRISRPVPAALCRGVTAAVGWLRALSGDDAYERYLTHHARTQEGAPLSRRDFYAQREAAKWSGISRCC